MLLDVAKQFGVAATDLELLIFVLNEFRLLI